ncbi:MAG: biotin/lipoyl-binding protein [Nitrospiraceae bacterium]
MRRAGSGAGRGAAQGGIEAGDHGGSSDPAAAGGARSGADRTGDGALAPGPCDGAGEVALDLRQVAKITSRIDGQIEQVHVQLGDRVKPGQPSPRSAACSSIS